MERHSPLPQQPHSNLERLTTPDRRGTLAEPSVVAGRTRYLVRVTGDLG